MSLIGSFPKQPREADIFELDYTGYIAGRVVDSIACTPTVPAGISSAGNQFFGNVLQVKYHGGTNGNSYRFVLLTTITIAGYGHVVERELDIVVAEFPDVA